MIIDNISRIKEEIISVCVQKNIDADSVKIVAVSKGRSVKEIIDALNSGISDIGENKVQEALIKFNELSALRNPRLSVRWHMVGHLQTNKAKEAVKIFDLIQSVDSLRLAQEINKQAERINKIQDILIEVNTSGEASKFGFKPEEAVAAAKTIRELKNLRFLGLMTIAPLAGNPEDARLYFRRLRELRDCISSLELTAYRLELSMGMTDDYKIALEEGANMIRLGRAIFGG